jgi:DNA replicative helicase MCM subunit Mcm2 (Cdc46/Mcm family)
MKKLEEVYLLKRPVLNVDFAHIKKIDQTMSNQLLAYPEEVILIFDIAVNELFFKIYKDDILPHQIQVRPYNVDVCKNNMHSVDPKGFN